MSESVRPRRRSAAWWLLLIGAVVAQLHLLYRPDVPGPALFAGADKVVHAVLFAAPTLVALLGRLRPRVVLPLLALHAPVSELVQGRALQGRTGDPWDAVADLVGIALAAGLWWVVAAARGESGTSRR